MPLLINGLLMITLAYYTLLTQPPPVVYRPFCSIARVSRINHLLFPSLMHWSPPQNTFCSPLLVYSPSSPSSRPFPSSPILVLPFHLLHLPSHLLLLTPSVLAPISPCPEPLNLDSLDHLFGQISCLTRFAEEWQGGQRKKGALGCPVSIPLMTHICCACTAHTLVQYL